MSEFPKVTILLATFNRANLIVETLQSIQNQTYQNWECIIIDDYSADCTKEVIEEFIKKDRRYSYYLKTKNYEKGLSGTRNQGLDIAAERNAEFIQLFDDDDIMHPRKLELQIEPFFKNTKLDLTISLYRKFHSVRTIDFNLGTSNDNSYNLNSTSLFEDFFFNRININSLGPLWKYNSIKKYRFDESLFYAEEREFYLRVFLIEKINYQPINYVLFWYRKHDKAITSNLYKNQNIKLESEKKVNIKIFFLILKERKYSFKLLKHYLKVILKSSKL
jgi:GalNAc5-diNAcBac-PP-undecaprenol beta-1,3-glucosyltransferase